MAQVYWCEKVLGFYRLRLVIVIFSLSVVTALSPDF